MKFFIDLYFDYTKGWLPFRGTKTEQPVKLMQIFDIIESAQARMQKEKEDLQQRILNSDPHQKQRRG